MITSKTISRLFNFRGLILLAILCASSLFSSNVYGKPPAFTLREKDVKKGEEIVAQLRRLEQLTASSTNFQNYGTLIKKMYPGLFVKVSELKESDLKTDLTTAVFLYEQAFRELKSSIEISCEDEMRGVYAKVCAQNQSSTALQLLWAKARLHTDWSASVIKYHQGATDAATIATLEEIRSERRNDLVLAEKAVASLKLLEEEVCAYSSLAKFEERGKIAHVSFERFSVDATKALRSVDRILQSLPHGPLFYSLYNARNAYANGLFWWQKSYSHKRLVVDVKSLNAPDEVKLLGFDPGVVSYTVVINWRNAVKRTRQAEEIIEAARTKG